MAGSKKDKVLSILNSMNILCANEDIEAFRNTEDGSAYEVWKINAKDQTYVLKRAKGCEAEIYSLLSRNRVTEAPTLINTLGFEHETYILIEYIEGKDLSTCDRNSLIKALDCLISLQNKYWNNKDIDGLFYSFDKSLEQRKKRKDYLNDGELERVYQRFLDIYQRMPRTLCHDDLLPFNLLITDDKATIIDWEFAGSLPYLTSLARLIAHTEEAADAFFYMTDEDKRFAIDYYYDNLVKSRGIDYREYRFALDLFIFYEYCEWIMLGVKYADADMERYDRYLKKAKRLIERSKL